MTATENNDRLAETARLGDEVFENYIRAKLRAEDDGKFIVIDVNTADYEIDEDDYTAVHRLMDRKPGASIWLRRTDSRAAYKLGFRSTFPTLDS